MFNPDPALFSAEVRPAVDESRPVVGPNLATDEDLARQVTMYVAMDFLTGYWLMQQRMYPVWDRIDGMWRGTAWNGQIDIGQVQRQSGYNDNSAQAGGFGTANQWQPWAAKVTPAAMHKQIDAITALGCALSWEDGDMPVQARKPRTTFETPAYNPVSQKVTAANAEMRRQADEQDLKRKYRIGLGNYVKYGHSWALHDFSFRLETVECRHQLPADPMLVNAALVQLRNYYRHPEQGYERDAMGNPVVVFLKTIPRMITNYHPLDVSSVFIDILIPQIQRQPCPIVKTPITRWELQQNPYDPVGNPFGWQNIEMAIRDSGHQFILSQIQEQEWRNRLLKRWGANSLPANLKPENTLQELWTAYPLLSIAKDENGKLKLYTEANGGPRCPHCNGTGKMQAEEPTENGPSIVSVNCQECKGIGNLVVKAERYVVQWYGSLYVGGMATCVRIQRNPTSKDKVPILFAAHLVEDTATAIPVSKSEIAICAQEQLATGHNQFLDSKSRTINRGWFKRVDSLAYQVNCNQPNATIPFESNPDNEVRRVESNQFDETATLIPYIQMMESEVEKVFGVNDTVLGEISAGRRAASEITLADEGSKRPLVQQIDQFNAGHMGGWAQAMLDDIEAWSDRDLMIERTGSPVWGRLDLHTAVGEEMLSTQAAIGNYRYLLEASATNPAMQGMIPTLIAKLAEAMKLDLDVDELEQGKRKAQQTAFQILTTILGEGILVMPEQTDPDEIYLGVFQGCMSDISLSAQSGKPNHWLETAPQNIPLLQQRIVLQQQQLAIKQQQMMIQQAQQMQMQMQLQAENDPRANQPERPGKPAKTPGEARQKTGA